MYVYGTGLGARHEFEGAATPPPPSCYVPGYNNRKVHINIHDHVVTKATFLAVNKRTCFATVAAIICSHVKV